MKVIKQNAALVSKIRAMQKVVFSILNCIPSTRANGISNIQKTVSKFMFDIKPTPNQVRKTKLENLFVLKYGLGLRRIKSRIARMEVAVEGTFLI